MQLCPAQDYYADSLLVIEENGDMIISGIADHPGLAEGRYSEYTTKKWAVWTLNISFPEEFSEYVYEAVFPEGASITYLNVPKSFRMEEKDGRIHLIAVAEDERFFLTAQYTISAGEEDDYMLILAAAGVLLSAAVLLIRRRPEKKKADYDPGLLTERQKEITEFLERGGEGRRRRECRKDYLFLKLTFPET